MKDLNFKKDYRPLHLVNFKLIPKGLLLWFYL